MSAEIGVKQMKQIMYGQISSVIQLFDDRGEDGREVALSSKAVPAEGQEVSQDEDPEGKEDLASCPLDTNVVLDRDGQVGTREPPPASSSSVGNETIIDPDSVSVPMDTYKQEQGEDEEEEQEHAKASSSNPSVSSRSPTYELMKMPAHQQRLLKKRDEVIGKSKKRGRSLGGRQHDLIRNVDLNTLLFGEGRDRTLLGLRVPTGFANSNGVTLIPRRPRRGRSEYLKTHVNPEVKLIHMEDKAKMAIQPGFWCTCGGESFLKRGTLLNHIKYYNQDWKFYCTACPQRFFSTGYLRNHLKERHQIDLPAGTAGCTKCGNIFNSHADLLRHQKNGECPITGI